MTISGDGAQPAPGRSGWRVLAGRVAREPLVHFLLAGLALFLVAEHHRAATDAERIVVTPERAAQLRAAYALEYGHVPDAAAYEWQLRRWIGDEMLYREALARGLDRDDEIVRRRLVQKLRILADEQGTAAEPGEADLRQWYESHRAAYASAGAVSFSHVFFADAAGGRGRAAAVLAGLTDRIARAPERGDLFPDLTDFSAFTPEAALRLFGQSELSKALFTAPAGHWAGPFRSAYGWHLVRVSARQPGTVPAFAAVRDAVAEDLAAARRDAAQARTLADLRAKYTVVREDRR